MTGSAPPTPTAPTALGTMVGGLQTTGNWGGVPPVSEGGNVAVQPGGPGTPPEPAYTGTAYQPILPGTVEGLITGPNAPVDVVETPTDTETGATEANAPPTAEQLTNDLIQNYRDKADQAIALVTDKYAKAREQLRASLAARGLFDSGVAAELEGAVNAQATAELGAVTSDMQAQMNQALLQLQDRLEQQREFNLTQEYNYAALEQNAEQEANRLALEQQRLEADIEQARAANDLAREKLLYDKLQNNLARQDALAAGGGGGGGAGGGTYQPFGQTSPFGNIPIGKTGGGGGGGGGGGSRGGGGGGATISPQFGYQGTGPYGYQTPFPGTHTSEAMADWTNAMEGLGLNPQDYLHESGTMGSYD